MTDGVVQVATDGAGKKIDTTELTRADGTTIVERQRINISDAVMLDAHAGVSVDGLLQVESPTQRQLLTAILIELKTISYFLNTGMNIRQNTQSVRKEMARDSI